MTRLYRPAVIYKDLDPTQSAGRPDTWTSLARIPHNFSSGGNVGLPFNFITIARARLNGFFAINRSRYAPSSISAAELRPRLSVPTRALL